MAMDKGKDMVGSDTKDSGPHTPLRPSLFESSTVANMRAEYLESKPYRHLIIQDFMKDNVLQGACEELKINMQATLKETDIYKVYQTGDLANMDSLPEESQRLLPSLFALRGALYSLEFRRLVQRLTGSGPLSGEKIDLSVNAYGHTGHLLCHDDVIGTRKVSYILYLVDQDWGSREKPDGGGLQLYPLDMEGVPGVPAFAPSKVIPPKWNQMVLFAVQPGRSFHDVQEVYNEHKPRLAVSGWFHGALPSEVALGLQSDSQGVPRSALLECAVGEPTESDYENEEVAGVSTLAQLEGGGDIGGRDTKDDGAAGEFLGDFGGTEDMGDLAGWINSEYLSSSMVEQCAEAFTDNGSSLQLHRFLKDEVSKKVLEAVRASDSADGLGYMEASPFDTGVRGGWRQAGPPHRQRMLRLSQIPPAGESDQDADDEIGKLMRDIRDKLFKNKAFKSLLEGIAGASISASRSQARRFRPGLDYTLATPAAPWVWKGSPPPVSESKDEEKVEGKQDDAGDAGDADPTSKEEGSLMVLDAILCFVDDTEPYKEAAWRQDEVGGYVTYLGGEDEDDDPGSKVGGEEKGVATGNDKGGEEKEAVEGEVNGGDVGGSKGQDAAVYRDDEGGSLVSVSAASNTLSLVLRDDVGILSFVKYVSSAAPGSRFDVFGEFLVVTGEDSDSEEEGVKESVVGRGLEMVEEGDEAGEELVEPGKKRARFDK
ncbi:unnamed protein product [Choristocarpus tenellus]